MGIWFDVLGHGIKEEDVSGQEQVISEEVEDEASEETPLIRDENR